MTSRSKYGSAFSIQNQQPVLACALHRDFIERAIDGLHRRKGERRPMMRLRFRAMPRSRRQAGLSAEFQETHVAIAWNYSLLDRAGVDVLSMLHSDIPNDQ